MHTSTELRRDSFELTVGGAPATVDELWPGFTAADRVGIVVDRPYGALGASNVLLAAITAFYDRQRERGDDFFIYPDYFCFHVGGQMGHHGMLDVWPAHKDVVVGGGEELLRAVNDRGVTRLVVPEGPAAPLDAIEREALASARARIVSALEYSPSGRVAGADVEIAGNDVSESYVTAVVDATWTTDDDPYIVEARRFRDRMPATLLEEVHTTRRALHEDGRARESYRRITLDAALGRIAALTPAG
jgi:hypothetical protein